MLSLFQLKTEYELNEELEDSRRFELWYVNERSDQYTFQARSVPVKEVWCELLRKYTTKYGQCRFYVIWIYELTILNLGIPICLI